MRNVVGKCYRALHAWWGGARVHSSCMERYAVLCILILGIETSIVQRFLKLAFYLITCVCSTVKSRLSHVRIKVDVL